MSLNDPRADRILTGHDDLARLIATRGAEDVLVDVMEGVLTIANETMRTLVLIEERLTLLEGWTRLRLEQLERRDGRG